MKKYFYFIGTAVVLLFVAFLLISQILLSSRIKKGITDWALNHGVESSDFKCSVNLLTRNITLSNLTFKQGENNFQVERVKIYFYLSDLLSDRSIRLIHIDKTEITLKNFIPFPIPIPITSDPDNNPSNLPDTAKNSFLIDEVGITNLILKIGLPDGNNIPDINVMGSFKNIGLNRRTTYLINASANSSFMEIKGDFNFDDWKKYFTYQLKGKEVSLRVINVLEEGFLPSQVREQLLSLYFKDILLVKLYGKLDITGNGDIKEGAIDSKLKFVVSDLSCEAENENIKSLIKRISSKGDMEISYKISGTLKNPYLTYDIAF